METKRLRTIRQPSSVERLLDLFVTTTKRVPKGACPVRTHSALPHALMSRVQQAQLRQRAWCAWTDDKRTWFFTAEMSFALSRERGMPVFEINAYSEQGELQETGFWTHDEQGSWHRCAD
jgi:hypothetical protein